jgi:hypothetical protein
MSLGRPSSPSILKHFYALADFDEQQRLSAVDHLLSEQVQLVVHLHPFSVLEGP